MAAASRSRSGSPAMTAQLWVLMKICPYRFVFEPIFRPASPKALTYHSPSQAWVSIAATSRSLSARTSGVLLRRLQDLQQLEEPVEHGDIEHGAPDALAAVPAADVIEGVVPIAAAELRQAVGARVRPGEAGHRQEMVQDGPVAPVEERLLRVEQPEVARLLEVFGHGEDEPERIVAVPGEFALSVAVEMMIDPAVPPHLPGQEPDARPGPGRVGDDDGDRVLGRVAIAEAAPDAPVIEAGHAADVERDLGLIGDPIIQEDVGFGVRRRGPGMPEEAVPLGLDPGQGRVDRRGVAVLPDDRRLASARTPAWR